ncbi:MAG: hypothetical protein BZY75_01705 [SAR202 cluster bacterium Io17-Chloro-G7]|nr:MAG: hypothetical protein BZY75_01705 [SAR202 cluster bacterium Io17-Chloro-G7]
MTSRRDENQGKISELRSRLIDLLSGMDYCLDWKADSSSWSPRQVVYHILDTPLGGIHKIVKGMLSGDIAEFEIRSDLDNMTVERMGYDIDQVRGDIEKFFHELDAAVDSASAENFDGKSALLHLPSRGVDESRTVQELLDRAFEGHWTGHLAQINDIRDALGM